MAELLTSGGDDIVVQVQRQHLSQDWRFDLVIDRDDWERLLKVNAPGQPRTSREQAYQQAKDFWDHLAERNADDLQESISRSPRRQHAWRTWPDLASLQRAYDAFNSE